jgi:hypothetical protein
MEEGNGGCFDCHKLNGRSWIELEEFSLQRATNDYSKLGAVVS